MSGHAATGHRDCPLRRKHQRGPDGARLPETTARNAALATGRPDLRHLRRRPRRHDGRPRPARRFRVVHVRAAAAGHLLSAPALAAADQRHARVHAAETLDERLARSATSPGSSPSRTGSSWSARRTSRRTSRQDRRRVELVYSAWTTPPEEMAQAILASAAISALVLPMRVGDRIATDGAWVRNFPLAHAYEHDEVEMIVSFLYVPRYAEPRHRSLRAPAPPQPLPARAAREEPPGRARRGRGARAPRRAGTPRRDDRPVDAARRRAEHRARGDTRDREGRLDP